MRTVVSISIMIGFIMKLCQGGGNRLRPRQSTHLIPFHNNKQLSLPACFHTNIHYTTKRYSKTPQSSLLPPKNCNSIRTLSTVMARSYDYFAHDDNFNFEEYNNEGEPSSSGHMNQQQQTPQQERRADEFDSMFFTPISSKPKVSGEKNTPPSYVENNSAQDVSNFDNKGIRPRETASTTNNDPQSRRNVKPQASQQDILSTRALYQFHPGSGGREIPPSISDYDSYEDVDYDYNNINKAEEENSNKDMRNNMDVYSSNDDAEKATSYDNTGDSMSSSSSTNFFDDDIVKVEQPMKIQKTLSTIEKVVKSASSNNETTTTTAPDVSLSSMSKPAFSRARARTVTTPSFMEPIKTKSLIDLSSTTVRNSSSSKQQRIPSEASSGNGSTSHLTTLMHQLEHLTSQIYQLNNGVEFNINSPKQVAIVLFGEDCTGDTSTNKDVLEAMSSAGNEMAACIYKFRKLSREIKREERRMKQQEKGDSKNDYYGNLARRHSVADDDAKKKNENAAANVEMFQTVPPTNDEVSATTKTNNNERRREPLLLIDISAYIFRAYHAIPPLHHSDGTPTGALHGVCRMLQNLLLPRLLKGDRPRVVLAFDFKGPNFRHEVYPEYKANRGPAPDDLVPQFALVREAAEAFGIDQVEAKGWEADDVIATLAMQARNDGVDVDILSGDKDLMQLITPPGIEPSIHMVDPMHFERVDHDDVVKKWGVSSEKLGDLLALAGDSSDNIPGCPGIGPKIAATLINEFGSLDDLLEQAGTIKQNKRRENLIENAEKVRLSRKLVTLDDSIPISKMTLPPSFQDVSSLRMSTFDPNRLLDFYKRMELNTIQNQLESRLRSIGMNFKQPPTPDEYKDVPF